VNFILSGDNAVVIAMAVRTLPPRQQKLGIFWGSFGAVALRIVLTVVAPMSVPMVLWCRRTHIFLLPRTTEGESN
jgi:predicted tellurium resistance membrane protein TerC